MKNHSSIWYANSRNYVSFLREDLFIRDFIQKRLSDVCISEIEIKRKLNLLVINIYVPKPSIVMGVNSSRLYELRNSLMSLLTTNFHSRDIVLNVFEVVSPDSDARILSDFVRQQLEKRVPFRRVIKSAILRAQKASVKGVKIQVSGRLNGAEIARTEWVREGRVPLHTLKANIDYFNFKAHVI